MKEIKEDNLESKVADALSIMRDAFMCIDGMMMNEDTTFIYKCYQIGLIQKDIEEAYAILAKAIGEEGYE